jgi:hypothetical protein
MLALLALGCSGGSGTGVPDASGIDQMPADARVPQPAKTHTLYLHTEGIVLTPGEDDAINNKSAIVTQSVALAAFLQGDPDRQMKIDEIVLQLRDIVAPYDITIVSTRPTAGDYSMVVLTDDMASKVGLDAQLTAVTRSSCNQRSAPVAFEFGYFGRDYAARNAIAMFADQAAIPFSKLRGDCMCFSHLVCSVTMPCTIGGPDTPIDPDAGCATGETTMDEAALFLAVFGPRP